MNLFFLDFPEGTRNYPTGHTRHLLQLGSLVSATSWVTAAVGPSDVVSYSSLLHWLTPASPSSANLQAAY